jgi:hypothetical protein
MTNRPSFEEIRNIIWYGDLSVFCNVFLILLFLVTIIIANKNYVKERKINGINGEKTKTYSKKITTILLVVAFIITTHYLIILTISNSLSKTTDDSFFNLEANEEWYAQNFKILYKDITPKEYKLQTISHLENVNDNLFGDTLVDKKKLIYRKLSKNERNDVYFFKASSINENNNVKEIFGMVTIKIDPKIENEKALLYETENSPMDIGENLIYGEIILKKIPKVK